MRLSSEHHNYIARGAPRKAASAEGGARADAAIARSFAVIFDMDGVLVDSAGAHLRAWQRLGTEIGVPFTEQRFRDTFGQRNASIIPNWLGEASAERISELERRKESLYRGIVRNGGMRVFPGVHELFSSLHAVGAKLAVASSGPRANVALLLDIIAVPVAVDVTVVSEDVQAGKPDPEAFLIAAQRLRLPVRCCAVVEDSVHGIEAAKRADMLAIAVLTSTERRLLTAAGADLLVPEIAALHAGEVAQLIRARME